MKTYNKILIGGLGALTPVIMNLLVIDLEVLLLNVTLFAVLGYSIRVIILFYLGGITAFLHKDENSPVKIFELGIVAPALITALLNAGQIDIPKMKTETASNPISSIRLVSAVYAQTNAQTDSTKIGIKSFSMPEETKIQQFWRGLTGSSRRNVWFVIAGSHLKIEDAQQQVQQILNKSKDFKPQIYEPYRNTKYYAVIIGEHLTKIEARKVQKKAIEAGLPKDTYLWTFPKE
jgi:hypothetical protein